MAERLPTVREQLVGFPWMQILVIAVVRVAEPIAFTSLFTYVYFMVRDFGIAKDDGEVAMYSGYLSSAFAFGQVISSFNWGRFADRFGRKPTILIGLSGSICSLLLLGFSTNYWMALAARLVMGLLNGNIGVLRTMIGETVHDKKHQSLAFAATPLAYQTGASIGPLIGGYLVSLENTPFSSINALIKAHRYALPNIVVSFCLMASITIALLFMEETHPKYKHRRDLFIDMGDQLQIMAGLTPNLRSWNEKSANDLEEQEQLILEGSSSYTDIQSANDSDNTKSVTHVQTMQIVEEQSPKLTWREILTPMLLIAISSSFVNTLHSVVFAEFMPIYLSYDVARDDKGHLRSVFPFKLMGGLGFTPSDTGNVLSITGFFGVFFVLVVLPQMTRRFEPMQIYTKFVVFIPLVYFVTPWVVLLADYMPLAKLVVYLISTSKTLVTSMCFPQMMVTINTLSPSGQKAQINGALISIQASAKCFGPMIWGYFMSWGQNYEIGWLGWWLSAGLGCIAVIQSRFLKNSLESGAHQI